MPDELTTCVPVFVIEECCNYCRCVDSAVTTERIAPTMCISETALGYSTSHTDLREVQCVSYSLPQLWHSHQYEVKSGMLTEPNFPANVDKEAMKILVNTYGKTFHTWRYDQKDNDIPLG